MGRLPARVRPGDALRAASIACAVTLGACSDGGARLGTLGALCAIDLDCAPGLICDPGARVCDTAAGDAGNGDAGGPTPSDAGKPVCGNGVAEPGESCDGTDLAGYDCTLWAGYVGGTLSCTGLCNFDVSGCVPEDFCGDDEVDSGEQCDGADLGTADCTTLGWSGGTLSCSPSCWYVATGCYTCGNGTAEPGEWCDGEDLATNTCVTRGYDGGGLACGPDCLSFDESLCTTCGDGLIEDVEQCEGADLAGQSCETLGFPGGSLGCWTSCGFDVAACTGPPPPPVPRLPMNGAWIGSVTATGTRRPHFAWEGYPLPATTYELEYSEDATFGTATTILVVAATIYEPPADLPVSLTVPKGARYWWRVRACDAAMLCSAWSATRYFNLGRNATDFNGDSFGDVLVSPYWGGTEAYVYLGAPAFNATADGLIDLTDVNRGLSIASLGDVNADGFGDLAVGGGNTYAPFTIKTEIHHGGAGTTLDVVADLTFPDLLFAATIGDVNGDGFDDLLLDGDIHLGTPAGVDPTAAGSVGPYQVAAGCDVDGDGFSDVVREGESGGIEWFRGGAGLVFDSIADGAMLGQLAVSCGDVNGDGFGDVVTGDYALDQVYVYSGSASPGFTSPDLTISGPVPGSHFGLSLSVVGDTDGDAYGDLVVGAQLVPWLFPIFCTFDAGQAYVYRGGPALFDVTPALIIDPLDCPDSFFGRGIGGPGDVNGDGRADWAIGRFAGVADGVVRVYFGSTTLNGSAEATLDEANEFFGYGIVSNTLSIDAP